VSTAALALALGAAVLHAFWNLVLAGSRDVEAATALTLALAVLLYAPVAAVTWDVEPEVWPYALGSAALELAYVVLLAAAYRRAELSVVYPVSRGVAPVLVLLIGLAALDAGASAAQVAGVLGVAVGVILVRGLRRGAGIRGLAFGLAIAACIAGYTLVDSRGIRHADPLGYLELVMAGPALAYLIVVARIKGPRAIRAELRAPVVLAALAIFGAFALALAALRIGPVASVAAVRETSVVIAVGLAAVALRERVGPARLGGAVLVTAGVALLTAG
jgi:drug/metabolite transporter (DMT)-like permease